MGPLRAKPRTLSRPHTDSSSSGRLDQVFDAMVVGHCKKTKGIPSGFRRATHTHTPQRISIIYCHFFPKCDKLLHINISFKCPYILGPNGNTQEKTPPRARKLPSQFSPKVGGQ